MIISNTVSYKTTIILDMVFEGATSGTTVDKHVEVGEGDEVDISFRDINNSTNLIKKGKIVKIFKPATDSTYGIVRVDCSIEYNSEVYNIETINILDIDLV